MRQTTRGEPQSQAGRHTGPNVRVMRHDHDILLIVPVVPNNSPTHESIHECLCLVKLL